MTSRERHVRQIKHALRSELRKAMQRSCILCQNRATNAHVWLPNPEHIVRHGGDTDKQRVYCYGVCDEHDPNQMHLFESKEVIQGKIDAVIRQKLAG